MMRISKHSPDDCPAFEAKNRDIFLRAIEKHDQLASKHKIKIVGSWVDSPAHTVYSIYDTPSMEDLMAYTMEPEIMAAMSFQITEIKSLTPAKDVAAILESRKR
jgi:hypothetical protein